MSLDEAPRSSRERNPSRRPSSKSASSLSRLLRGLTWAALHPLETRPLVATFLDLHFASTSPIPVAGPVLLRRLHSHPVWLPPTSLLGTGNQGLTGLSFLAMIGQSLAAETIFEIGTYNGVTAWTFARNLPTATVHTLDLPAGVEPSLDLGPSDQENIVQHASRAYEGTPEESRVVQHYGDSASFDFAALAGKCDLVYVDGAHSPAYIRNDTARAFELVGSSGAVIWDDYWRRLPHVAEFLDSLARPLVRLPGSRLVAWFAPDASLSASEAETESQPASGAPSGAAGRIPVQGTHRGKGR